MAAGSIVVDLLMRTGSFETDTARASKKAQQAAKDIEKQFVKAGQAIAIGFTAAQTALTALVVKTTQTATEIDRFAKLANSSAESFQVMAIGADKFGIQQEKLADILKDVQDKVGDFLQTGGGPLADFFEKIAPQVGVTAEQFRKLGGADALQLYISSLEKANISQNEMTFYLEAIASDATLLLPLLQNNGQALKEFGDQAQRTGQVMSNDLIRQSIQFQENMKELIGLLKGFANTIVASVLPSLLKFADELIAGTQATNGLIDAIRTLGFAKPFDDAGKGAKYYRDELNKLKAARDKLIQQEGVLANTSGFDRDIELAQKRLAYFNNLQLRQVNRTIDAGDQSGAEARRLGLSGPTALPAPVSVKAPKAKAGARESEAPMLFTDVPMDQSEMERAAAIAKRKTMLEGESEAIREYNQLMDEGRRIYESTRTPLEQLNAEELRLTELLKEGAIDWDTYSRAVMQANDTYAKATEGTKELSTEMDSFAKQAAENIQDQLGEGLYNIMQGNFKDIGASFTQMINRMVAEAMAAKIARALFGDMVSGGEGEGIFGGILKGIGSAMFGGAKAGGGDTISGRAYLVGENGPEMFVPRTAGAIIPNDKMEPKQRTGNTIINVQAVQGMTRDTALQQGQRIAMGMRMAQARNG